MHKTMWHCQLWRCFFICHRKEILMEVKINRESVYRTYQQNDYTGQVPTLQDFRDELLKQDEPEAKEIALAIELFTHGSLNTFAKQTTLVSHG